MWVVTAREISRPPEVSTLQRLGRRYVLQEAGLELGGLQTAAGAASSPADTLMYLVKPPCSPATSRVSFLRPISDRHRDHAPFLGYDADPSLVAALGWGMLLVVWRRGND